MINSIDDIMKLVNAGFNASQIAELAKLGEVPEPKKEVPEETKKEEPEKKEEIAQEVNPEIEALKAQVAALQAANVAANVGGSARQETASDVIANVLKDFY